MKLKVLSSGSSGNGYILESDTEALIIEAGVPLKDVKVALGFNVRKIVGVICSHRHGDHFQYVKEYLKSGLKVVVPEDCLNDEIVKYGNLFVQHPMFCRDLGKFHINAFDLVHDVECLGFHVQHPDIGTLLYASDTEYIKYRFKNLNHILVEANYSDDLIDNEAVNREHVLRGHMSLQTALDFISTNDNPALRNVVLLHLSDKNSDSEQFLQKTKETVKYGADCYIAEKGLEVDLNLCPF